MTELILYPRDYVMLARSEFDDMVETLRPYVGGELSRADWAKFSATIRERCDRIDALFDAARKEGRKK